MVEGSSGSTSKAWTPFTGKIQASIKGAPILSAVGAFKNAPVPGQGVDRRGRGDRVDDQTINRIIIGRTQAGAGCAPVPASVCALEHAANIRSQVKCARWGPVQCQDNGRVLIGQVGVGCAPVPASVCALENPTVSCDSVEGRGRDRVDQQA